MFLNIIHLFALRITKRKYHVCKKVGLKLEKIVKFIM